MTFLTNKTIKASYRLNNSIYIETTDSIHHIAPKKIVIAAPDLATGKVEDASMTQIQRLESVLGADCLSNCTVITVYPHPIQYAPPKGDNIVETWGYELKTSKGDVVFTYSMEHNGFGAIDMIFEEVPSIPNDAILLVDFI